MVALRSRVAMAFGEGCRPCIRATRHILLRDTNTCLPAVCRARTACFLDMLASSRALEEAVAVMVIRPGMSRLARRDRVRRSRVHWSRMHWSRMHWRRVHWSRRVRSRRVRRRRVCRRRVRSRRIRRRDCGSSSDKSGQED